MVESVTSLATAQSTIEDESQNLVAVDLDQHLTSRVEVSVSRIVRDTVLAAQVKLRAFWFSVLRLILFDVIIGFLRP